MPLQFRWLMIRIALQDNSFVGSYCLLADVANGDARSISVVTAYRASPSRSVCGCVDRFSGPVAAFGADDSLPVNRSDVCWWH